MSYLFLDKPKFLHNIHRKYPIFINPNATSVRPICPLCCLGSPILAFGCTCRSKTRKNEDIQHQEISRNTQTPKSTNAVYICPCQLPTHLCQALHHNPGITSIGWNEVYWMIMAQVQTTSTTRISLPCKAESHTIKTCRSTPNMALRVEGPQGSP